MRQRIIRDHSRTDRQLTHESELAAPHSFTVAFTPDETRVAHMRRITTAHLRMWAVPRPLADDIVLAVSELVTNGVRHGQGDVQLTVQYLADILRIEVADGNPKPATLRHARDDDETGRGPFLVAALARDWGVSADGRTTWCTFQVPAESR